jgi:PAS domain S-box-containing protein
MNTARGSPRTFRKCPFLSIFAPFLRLKRCEERSRIVSIQDMRDEDMADLNKTYNREESSKMRKLSDNIYRVLIEQANDGIAIIQDSVFKYVNPRASEMSGFSANELINSPIAGHLIPQENDELRDRNGRDTAGEKDAQIYETVFRHKDGRRINVEINAAAITYQDKSADLIIIRDVTQRRHTEEELNQTLGKLRKAMGATIQAVSLTIESRDPYTAGHQRRVADLARAIASKMELPREEIDGLRMGASVHDLGKISIPAEILSKPGRLNENEFRLIKNHPQVGYNILKQIDFPWPIAEMVLQHHERMNGSGYPHGLSGEEILLTSRILGVADVVEAMVSHRPYRTAHTLDEAMSEIAVNRGTLYDSTAVDACVKILEHGNFSFKQ